MVRGWEMMKGYHDPPPGAPPPFDGEGLVPHGRSRQAGPEGYLTYLGRLRERPLRGRGERLA